MKKKIIAIMSAIVLTIGCAMTVYAESPTAGTTETPVEGQEVKTDIQTSGTVDQLASGTSVDGATTAKVSDTTLKSANVAVQNNLLNDVAKTGVLLGRTDLLNAATDANKTVQATIIGAVDVSSATKGADGKYDLTFKNSAIAANSIIALEHYGSYWETLVPYEIGDGYVKVKSSSCSPFVMIKIDILEQQAGASPKTGEALPIVAIALVVIGGAGAVIFGRKFFKASKAN